MNTGTAESWIDTDPDSCRNDVKRLSLDGATDYEMDLIADRISMGDNRWINVTETEMRTALMRLTT